ncbi:hypothetical protein DAI22_12g109550 [Oryza sativa Japonica Group]|nr:hypothetical protein DAI22_12g109550 [Oryza sativa Japonica Group]
MDSPIVGPMHGPTRFPSPLPSHTLSPPRWRFPPINSPTHRSSTPAPSASAAPSPSSSAAETAAVACRGRRVVVRCRRRRHPLPRPMPSLAEAAAPPSAAESAAAVACRGRCRRAVVRCRMDGSHVCSNQFTTIAKLSSVRLQSTGCNEQRARRNQSEFGDGAAVRCGHAAVRCQERRRSRLPRPTRRCPLPRPPLSTANAPPSTAESTPSSSAADAPPSTSEAAVESTPLPPRRLRPRAAAAPDRGCGGGMEKGGAAVVWSE